MEKSLTEMTAELVCAQLSSTSMNQEDVSKALHSTFSTLRSLKDTEATGASEAPQASPLAETPLKSIQKHKIICLECGEESRSLSSKHLQEHGLTGKEYRKKWGLSLRQPLCAKELTAQRKAAGKKRGLPENLRKAILAKKAKEEQAPAKVASTASRSEKPKTTKPKSGATASKDKTAAKPRKKATTIIRKAGKPKGSTE